MAASWLMTIVAWLFRISRRFNFANDPDAARARSRMVHVHRLIGGRTPNILLDEVHIDGLRAEIVRVKAAASSESSRDEDAPAPAAGVASDHGGESGHTEESSEGNVGGPLPRASRWVLYLHGGAYGRGAYVSEL